MSLVKKLFPLERYVIRKYHSFKGWRENLNYSSGDYYIGASLVAGTIGAVSWGYDDITDKSTDNNVVGATAGAILGFAFYATSWPISGPLTIIKKYHEHQKCKYQRSYS
jgi:hypothetical protein